MNKALRETKLIEVVSDPTALDIRLYISDQASGRQARVVVSMMNEQNEIVHSSDKRLSDYSNLSTNQKLMFMNLAAALRDETFILENFLDVPKAESFLFEDTKEIEGLAKG